MFYHIFLAFVWIYGVLGFLGLMFGEMPKGGWSSVQILACMTAWAIMAASVWR